MMIMAMMVMMTTTLMTRTIMMRMTIAMTLMTMMVIVIMMMTIRMMMTVIIFIANDPFNCLIFGTLHHFNSNFHVTRNAFCFAHKILHKLLTTIPKCF